MNLVHIDFAAGIAAQRAGNTEQARACYLRVIESMPGHEAALFHLSSVLPSTEHALLCIDQLLTINPDHAEAQERQRQLRVRLMMEGAGLIETYTPVACVPRKRCRLGEALIQSDVLTYRQLDRALVVQARLAHQGQPMQIGQVLIRLGFVTADQIEAALADQIEPLAATSHGGHRFGSFLLRAGLISSAQLDYVVALQADLAHQGRATRIGELLVRLGYLHAAQLQQSLIDWQKQYVVSAG